MKIKFTKLPHGGTIKVSLDGGQSFTDYNIEDIQDSGIPLDDNQDYEKIMIKGPANVLKNLSIIKKIQLDTSNDDYYCGRYTYPKLYKNNFPGQILTCDVPEGIKYIDDYAFYGMRDLKSIEIPDSVIGIGIAAFFECESLTSIKIPDEVNSIRDSTFARCKNLTTFTIPKKVNWIGRGAFAGCEKLKEIIIPSSVKSIGAGAFEDCESLNSFCFPDGITKIECAMFDSCDNLTSVTIPDSVITIENEAFCACGKFSIINYKGSEEQWGSIKKGNGWADNPNRLIINYNYKG